VESLWWSRGGPRQFVESVLGTLQQGASVLVILPGHFENGFRYVLRNSASEICAWRSIDLSFETDSVSQMLGPLVAEDGNRRSPTARVIAGLEYLQNTIIWLGNLSMRPHRPWLEFLELYAHVSSNYRSTGYPPVFAGVISTQQPVREYSNEAALKILDARKCSDLLDMEAFVANYVRGSREASILRRTRIAVAAQLAGTDPVLAASAVSWDFEQLFRPEEFLVHWARDTRNWKLPGSKNIGDIDGGIEFIDGEERIHSAVAAIQGDSQEIMRRVWKGQVSVLLPLLEQHRIAFVEMLADYVDEGLGSATDDCRLIDLEIGQIAYALQQSSRGVIPRRIRNWVDIARKIRNSLAHLHPISAGQLRTLAQHPDNS